MMIEYKNISKKYDRQEILKDVSFAVKKGDIFVLVGPSGSGKTTLLKMFNRLIEPTKGQILLNDKPIKEYNLRKLREKTGYVLQDRKSTRLNSSHVSISYAVFCLKKKKPRSTTLSRRSIKNISIVTQVLRIV